MIDSFKFKNILLDLESMFTKLSDFQRDTYYKRLKHSDERALKKGVNYLMDTHLYKRTPLISEIKDSMAKAAIESTKATAEELDSEVICDKCNKTGIYLSPVLHPGKDYIAAFPCDCPKGQRIKAGWKNYFKKEKHKY